MYFTKMGWTTFWANFSQTHLVTLPGSLRQRESDERKARKKAVEKKPFWCCAYVHKRKNFLAR
jgi:hypothetical protein